MGVLDYAYTGLCILGCIWSIKNGKELIRALSFVGFGFAFIYYLMPKPYGFYWTIWTPFAAVVVGLVLEKLIESKEFLKQFLGMGILGLSCFLTGVYIFTNALWVPDSSFEEEVRLLAQRMKNTDQLVDYGDYRGHFLRNYPEHYYWFCLVRCGPLDVSLFHRHQMPDWDEVIYKQKPKYIMHHKVYDLTSADDDNRDIQIMGVDEGWLIKNYRYVEEIDTYERVENN